MQYAITSDLHLKADAPERLANLESILKLLKTKKITELIIAGDLFDRGYAGYRALDALLKQHHEINVTVLPGNHDLEISGGQFAAPNIRVIEKPHCDRGKRGELSFLFLPYEPERSMGEALEEPGAFDAVGETSFVLFSHGDFGPRSRALSGNEDGYYPLTRDDLARFRPARVVLGHIHKPSSLDAEVVYPGSPYPLDITETGRRRVLLLDRSDGTLEPLPLPFAPCNLLWDIFLLPDGEEGRQATTALDDALAAFGGVAKGQTLQVRVRLHGCSTDRALPEAAVRSWFETSGVGLESLDSTDLSYVEPGQSLGALTAQFEKKLTALQIPEAAVPGGGIRSRIRTHALRYIYRIQE